MADRETLIGRFGGEGGEVSEVPKGAVVVFDSGDGFKVGVHGRGLVDKVLRRSEELFLQDREQESRISLLQNGNLIARRSGGGEAVIRFRERTGFYRVDGGSEQQEFSLRRR